MASGIIFVTDQDTQFPGAAVTNTTFSAFEPASCAGADLVVIDHEHVGASLEAVRKIRRSADPSVYLLPIALHLNNGQNLPRVLSAAVDAVFHRKEAEAMLKNEVHSVASGINQRIAELRTEGAGDDTSVSFKILRLLFTRQTGATPAMTISSKSGFVYPPLDLFMDKQDTSTIKVLGLLESQGMLTSEFVDKMYACSHCGSAFLNFQEACGHCGSTNLKIDDLIHHFRCAYVAPLSDFTSPSGMVCPKCKHTLKEIGVDYDKPSEVYVCKDCGHTSQEVDTSTTCYNCLTKNPPENLEHHSVKRYAVTALGDNAARYGMEALFIQVLEQSLEIVPMSVFKKLLLVEAERIKRYQRTTSSVLYLQVANLNDIYVESAVKAKEVFAEFSEIMRSVLRTSDVIATLNEAAFVILLIETPLSGAETTIERIRERVEALITNNFKVAPHVIMHAIELSGDHTPEDAINQAVAAD